MNKYRNHAQAWNARHVPILQIQRHMRACESSEDSYGLGITYFTNLSSLMTGTFFSGQRNSFYLARKVCAYLIIHLDTGIPVLSTAF